MALGLVEDAALDHATVHDHERQLRRAVVEDEAAGVEFVVNVRGLAVLEAAVDRTSERRSDVARCRTGAKDTRRLRCRRAARERELAEQCED